MVGKKIRAYREFRGYSQIQLAELSGINVGTIRKYEPGIWNPKPDQEISLTFDNPTMQDFFSKWCQFKNVYEKEKAEILAIEDEDKRQEELDKLNATQEEWKLRAMGTTIGCHTVIKKGTEGNEIKTYDLT